MTEEDKLMFTLYAEQQIEKLPDNYKKQEEARHPLPEPPVWAVAANIVREHSFGEDGEIRRGTKNFKPGAKVYIALTQDWRNRVEVVGHSRGGRIIKIWTRIAFIENFRVEMVYSPTVIKRLTNYSWSWSSETGYTYYSWNGDEESRLAAEEMVERLSRDEQ